MGSPARQIPSLSMNLLHNEVVQELGGVIFTQAPRQNERGEMRVHFPGLNSRGHQKMLRVLKGICTVPQALLGHDNWIVAVKASVPDPVTAQHHAELAELRQRFPGSRCAAEALKALNV